MIMDLAEDLGLTSLPPSMFSEINKWPTYVGFWVAITAAFIAWFVLKVYSVMICEGNQLSHQVMATICDSLHVCLLGL